MFKSTKLKRVVFGILTATFVFLLSTSPLFAQSLNIQEEDGPKNVVLTKDQVINEDYFVSGETVSISGTVNGDTYILGGDVTITGTVNGDLIVAGGNVTLDGTVNGNARIAGGEVVINGTIEKNLTTLSGYTVITKEATLGGSLTSLSGDITLATNLAKGATLASATATISSVIEGNLTAAVEELNFADGTTVKGNVNYWSQTPATLATNATIEGDFNHFTPPSSDFNATSFITALSIFALTMMIIFFLASYIIGLLFLKIMPLHMDTMANLATRKTAKSLLYGAITLIAVPIAILLLTLTLLGIPLALILAVIYILVIYLSKIIAGYAIGRMLFEKKTKPPARGWVLLWGMLLLTVCEFIPFIGWAIGLAAIIVGVGAIIIAKEEVYNTLRDKKII